MTTLANLNVNLSLQSAQFIANLNRVNQATQQTATRITSTLNTATNAGKGLVAALGTSAMIAATKASFDYADSIQDLSDRTGASVKAIQEFRYAAQISGSSIEDADAALQKFSKNLGEAQRGNKAAADSLASVGVTSTDVDTALRQAADGISKLDTTSAQAAATTDLFGKSAQNLTNLMSQGSAGLDGFAQKAAELGIVLDAGLIANAGKVNDQLDTMKMVLDAQFSAFIVKNADSIMMLANAFMKITSAVIGFIQSNPKLAMSLLGAIAGFLTGGPIGAIIGAVGGFIGGSAMGKNSDASNNDLNFRSKKLAEAQSAFDLAKKNDYDKARLASAAENLKAEAGYTKRAIALQRQLRGGKSAPVSSVGGKLPTIIGKKTGGNKSTGPNAFETNARWLSELASADQAYLAARLALTSDINEQARLEREMLDIELADRKRRIEIDGPLGSKKLSEKQVEELKAYEDKIASAKGELIEQKKAEQLAADRVTIAMGRNNTERDLLSSAASMARTAGERRALELKLLDLQYEQEKIQLERVRDSRASSAGERQAAIDRLAALPGLKAGQAAEIARGTLSPGQQFLDQLPRSAAEIEESLESAAANGLGALTDGLADAIMGVGKLSDAFSNMADYVIAQLIRIALQKAIIEPIGQALFGSGSGGGGGGIFGSLLKIGTSVAASSAGGARANGGLAAPGAYLVGERGPEIATIGRTAHIWANSKLKSMGGGGGLTINVDARGATNPAEIEAVAARTFANMSPQLLPITYEYIQKRGRQPRM